MTDRAIEWLRAQVNCDYDAGSRMSQKERALLRSIISRLEAADALAGSCDEGPPRTFSHEAWVSYVVALAAHTGDGT